MAYIKKSVKQVLFIFTFWNKEKYRHSKHDMDNNTYTVDDSQMESPDANHITKHMRSQTLVQNGVRHKKKIDTDHRCEMRCGKASIMTRREEMLGDP
jgi:hypothetical protein